MTVARADLPTIQIRRGPERVTVVRAIARTALVIGVLVAGFVGYQFGVTSFLAQRGQVDLRSQLADRLTMTERELVRYEPLDLVVGPIAIPSYRAAFDLQSIPGLDPVSLRPPGDELSTNAFGEEYIVPESPPEPGVALGRLVIPAAGVDWVVVEGVSQGDLRTGAGHVPGTAVPGQQGNAVISGQRASYGAPFLRLDRLVAGDLISVETIAGTHVYQVVDSFVIQPAESWMTQQWNGAWLTLTTSTPVLSSSHRLIVVATLVAGPNAGVILDGS